jgi:hypothetical protein
MLSREAPSTPITIPDKNETETTNTTTTENDVNETGINTTVNAENSVNTEENELLKQLQNLLNQ